MDGFSQAIYDIAEGALSILPDSPFTFLSNYSTSPVGQWLGYLNWFIPVNSFIAILEAWLLAIGVYYLLSIILRWAKAIE
jgi:hypothetical protein